jgi:hypothetical protein
MANIYTSWRSIEPIAGLDFNQTYVAAQPVSVSVTSGVSNMEQSMFGYPGDALGTSRKGTNDSEWVLVKASSTVTQYNVVVWDDAFNANNVTTALAVSALGANCGLAQFTNYQGQTVTVADPAINPVFWACIRGVGLQVNVSGSAGTGVAVNIAVSQPGAVTISATATSIHRLVLFASATANAVVECSIRYPVAAGTLWG